MSHISISNNETIPLSSIPELDYPAFLEQNILSLKNSAGSHCVNYYGIPWNDNVRLICCIANDELSSINISSALVETGKPFNTFSKQNPAFEKFEREIHENFGIQYTDHPWLKPVRYPFNRYNKNENITDYPFFSIDSEELHEVGVGPIHAGIIEPGHFRFICNGEQILHLEIQLGYQHRGIEQLFIEKKKLLQRATLAENIAGDSVAGHTVAFTNLWESMCNYQPGRDLQLSRTLALELERIAVHTGNLSAMCTDIAYQLGSAVYGRLRTPIINFFQRWCGNRLAKGLIRAGKTNFPLTNELAAELTTLLNAYERDFEEISEELFNLPSALARFEKTGVLTREQAENLGTVGISARMSALERDIRYSHPHDLYRELNHQLLLKNHGDVHSRARLRKREIDQSIAYIRTLIQSIPGAGTQSVQLASPSPNSFTLSLVEGWRGEICHAAVTGENGELIHYKIKDPSFHNWMGLALAVRNNEISDFPICNKSFDLSYCGHDL
ncbi:hydrogenase large subunit [Flavihumibacter profundi]|uniref:hydrogenase large subunit n=1 Tax=Flavihumibacter profundi TaxID=2716883 RepID=UPI001CC6B4E5|nr:NADH-quinone oxidoreductase subunit C [Flavihumibacter profundi]MBZ5857098.1 NADH-quinone oxidoreductase subunit C [Flavihumibacter profundi]